MVILSGRSVDVCNISKLNSNSAAECNVILQYKDMERVEIQQISSSCTGIKSHTTKLSYVNCMVIIILSFPMLGPGGGKGLGGFSVLMWD